jgi:hypothetical protein
VSEIEGLIQDIVGELVSVVTSVLNNINDCKWACDKCTLIV